MNNKKTKRMLSLVVVFALAISLTSVFTTSSAITIFEAYEKTARVLNLGNPEASYDQEGSVSVSEEALEVYPNLNLVNGLSSKSKVRYISDDEVKMDVSVQKDDKQPLNLRAHLNLADLFVEFTDYDINPIKISTIPKNELVQIGTEGLAFLEKYLQMFLANFQLNPNQPAFYGENGFAIVDAREMMYIEPIVLSGDAINLTLNTVLENMRQDEFFRAYFEKLVVLFEGADKVEELTVDDFIDKITIKLNEYVWANKEISVNTVYNTKEEFAGVSILFYEYLADGYTTNQFFTYNTFTFETPDGRWGFFASLDDANGNEKFHVVVYSDENILEEGVNEINNFMVDIGFAEFGNVKLTSDHIQFTENGLILGEMEVAGNISDAVLGLVDYTDETAYLNGVDATPIMGTASYTLDDNNVWFAKVDIHTEEVQNILNIESKVEFKDDELEDMDTSEHYVLGDEEDINKLLVETDFSEKLSQSILDLIGGADIELVVEEDASDN